MFGPAEDGAESFMTLMHDDGKDFPENISINPATDVLFMPFSSGTSGLPKGVMLSHRNVVANILQCRCVLILSDALHYVTCSCLVCGMLTLLLLYFYCRKCS